jgi:uncharacterized damage-inducible protein DinB
MNPYAADLGDRDCLSSLSSTPARLRNLVARMTPADLERPHAPGKWTARQLLLHLAQAELAFSVRARMALTSDDYVVQPFDQDRWMALEGQVAASEALGVYETLRALNLALFRALSAEDRARTFQHPERGRMRVDEIPALLAGHELHHLAQLEAIAGQAR